MSSYSTVTLEEAVFRSEVVFKPANLQKHRQLLEEEILAERPQKTTLLNWIRGIRIEEFLNSFTDSLYSHSPQAQAFPKSLKIYG